MNTKEMKEFENLMTEIGFQISKLEDGTIDKTILSMRWSKSMNTITLQ